MRQWSRLDRLSTVSSRRMLWRKHKIDLDLNPLDRPVTWRVLHFGQIVRAFRGANALLHAANFADELARQEDDLRNLQR